MAIDWAAGYEVAYWRIRRVDPATWASGDDLARVDSASVSRSCGGNLEEGSITVTVDPAFEPEAGWYRTEMLAVQGARSELATLSTMHYEPGALSQPHAYSGWQMTMPGSSALSWASERLARFRPVPMFVRAGEDGAQRVAEMLRACSPAPVVVHGGFAVASDVVFGPESTALDCCWQLVDAAGWCMQVDGMGIVHVMPQPTEPSLEMDLLALQPNRTPPGTGRPNVLYVVDGTAGAVVVVNDDPASPNSVQRRGRRIELCEEDPIRIEGETLADYAKRRLRELGSDVVTYDYTREYWPGVLPYGIVRARVAPGAQPVDLRVSSQTLALGRGVTVQETVTQRLE